MKFLVVLALAAVALAEPEADPHYINGVYYAQHAPVATVAAPYYVNPYIYTNPIVPVAAVKTDDTPAPDTTADKPDDAEPKPEGDAKAIVPAVYNAAYAYTPYAHTYVNPVVNPVIYQAAPKYYAQSAAGVFHKVYRREAEADPAYYYNALPYAYNNFAYRAPAVYNYGYAAPYAYNYPRYFY